MKVKICGIRRLEDAQVAVAAGAWAVGFVFHPPSRRYIEPEAAREIARALPAGILTVGVFVDLALAELNRVVEVAGLRAVQLHGREDAEYARGVRAPTVIKAFRVGPMFQLADLDAFRGLPVLLDAHDPDVAGGTGRSFDWTVAREAAARGARVVLAGGLHLGNVGQAIREAGPWAIDVSSGVESAPGVKDAGKIRSLLAAVHAAPE